MKITTICIVLVALLLPAASVLGQQAFTQRIKFAKFDSSDFARGVAVFDITKKVWKDTTSLSRIAMKDVFLFASLPTFGIYGIGNLNTVQDFEAVNGAGKIAGFYRPILTRRGFVTAYFSFNKNATNSDSLLASTFLFPDVGTSSFAGTCEYSFLIKRPERRMTAGGREQFNYIFLAPFYEFAHKTIRGKDNKTDDDYLSFETLTHTIGARLQFSMHRYEDDASFSLAPYLSFVNVPNEDNDVFRQLFGAEKLPSSINSWGCKVVFQYNDFQVFADLKNVYNIKDNWGNERVRNIQGFNSNIGFVFNAQVFSR